MISEKDLQEEWAEAMKGVEEWHDEIARKNGRVLKAIRSVKSKSFYRSLSAYLKDLYYECYNKEQMEFALVKQPAGKLIKESWGKELKQHWVDQYSSGPEGDSYDGYIYIQLKEKMFLRVNYSM